MRNPLAVVDVMMRRPTFPSLPPALRSQIGIEASNPALNVDTTRWVPPLLTDAECAHIEREILPGYQAAMKPASGDRVAFLVTVLLSHFYVPDMNAAVLTAVVDDWVRGLVDLPLWAVEEARFAWVKKYNRRPTVAAIRALAESAIAQRAVELDRLRQAVALAPPANPLVAALWPAVRRGEVRRHEVERYVAPLAVTVYAGHVVARMHRESLMIRGFTRPLVDLASAAMGKKSAYLVGPDDPEPAPPTAEERAARWRNIYAILDGWRGLVNDRH